jgi:hypothetical protein
MRARRSGTIVNISSIGARVCPEGSGYYAAAKAAVEATTLSLRKELTPLGINATVVEPGAFRTDFAGRSLTQTEHAIADYAETAGRRRKELDRVHGTQPGDPAKAAAALLDAVESGNPPYLLLLGNDAVDAVAPPSQPYGTTSTPGRRPAAAPTSTPDHRRDPGASSHADLGRRWDLSGVTTPAWSLRAARRTDRLLSRGRRRPARPPRRRRPRAARR